MATEKKKERNKRLLGLATSFLQAIVDREDWHPFAQLRTRKMKAAPNMPSFIDFRVIRTHAPGRGLDPDVCRAIFVEITLGGNDRLELQTVLGKLLAIKECNWDVCPKCEGTGLMGDNDACPRCGGTGRIAVDPPRIPVKGSNTFEHDAENGVWGICPTSFEYSPDTQRRVDV